MEYSTLPKWLQKIYRELEEENEILFVHGYGYDSFKVVYRNKRSRVKVTEVFSEPEKKKGLISRLLDFFR